MNQRIRSKTVGDVDSPTASDSTQSYLTRRRTKTRATCRPTWRRRRGLARTKPGPNNVAQSSSSYATGVGETSCNRRAWLFSQQPSRTRRRWKRRYRATWRAERFSSVRTSTRHGRVHAGPSRSRRSLTSHARAHAGEKPRAEPSAASGRSSATPSPDRFALLDVYVLKRRRVVALRLGSILRTRRRLQTLVTP